MCVPYGMWGLKTQHVIQSGKENHCIVEMSWSWKNAEHLFHLCLSWNSSLTADTETDRLLLQHFPDLATGFSTPAGAIQREAVTQRRCAITVVKSGAARAPIQPRRHQSDPQSLTRKKARLVAHLAWRPDALIAVCMCVRPHRWLKMRRERKGSKTRAHPPPALVVVLHQQR